MASRDDSSAGEKSSSSNDAGYGDLDWNPNITGNLRRPIDLREEEDMVERAKRLSLADRYPDYPGTDFSFPAQPNSTSQPNSSPTTADPLPTVTKPSPFRTEPLTTSKASSLIWTNPFHTWPEAVQIHSNAEMPKLQDDEGDTAVYIDPPPMSERTFNYDRICRHFETPHVVSSQKLKNLQSPKIEALFAPTAQFRTKRRLANAGLNVRFDDRVKYFLDLRVPETDTEALVLLEGLTCSAGILAWARAQKLYNIPKKFICGQDNPDLLQGWSKAPVTSQPKSQNEKGIDSKDKDRKDVEEPSQKETKSSQPPEKVLNWGGEIPRPPSVVEGDNENRKDSTAIEEKHDPKPDIVQTSKVKAEPHLQEEYCPLRHRSAIERLLHAACGNSPHLDSAPKMWTYFAIAKYFECAHHPNISSEITVWLTEGSNSSFIQANPEVSYRIGMGIKSEHIVQTAFSILAAERALAIAQSPRALPHNRIASIHRTKVENLDDDEKNRVDHAANRFLHRITDLFHDLVDENMQWVESIPEYQRLLEYVSTTSNEFIARGDLLRTLKSHVRARIYHILCRPARITGRMTDHECEQVTKFYPIPKNLPDVYEELRCSARILSRTFWLALYDEHWEEPVRPDFDSRDITIPPGATILPRMNCPSSSDVQNAIEIFNDTLRRAAPHPEPFCHGHQAPEGEWQWSWEPYPDQTTDGQSDRFLTYSPFDAYAFQSGVGLYLHRLLEPVLYPAHIGQGGFRLPTFLIDTLLCLNEEEFKYLPLWAGGLDDGETGAVFEEADVPLLEAGGFAPGAGIHSAASAANSSTAGTDRFSDVASTAAGTVVAASHKATEGTGGGTASEYDVVSVVEAEVDAGTEMGDMDDVWEEVKRENEGKGKGLDMDVESLMEEENEEEDFDMEDSYDGFEDIETD